MSLTGTNSTERMGLFPSVSILKQERKCISQTTSKYLFKMKFHLTALYNAEAMKWNDQTKHEWVDREYDVAKTKQTITYKAHLLLERFKRVDRHGKSLRNL